MTFAFLIYIARPIGACTNMTEMLHIMQPWDSSVGLDVPPSSQLEKWLCFPLIHLPNEQGYVITDLLVQLFLNSLAPYSTLWPLCLGLSARPGLNQLCPLSVFVWSSLLPSLSPLLPSPLTPLSYISLHHKHFLPAQTSYHMISWARSQHAHISERKNI